MIYSPVFAGLPGIMKDRIFKEMGAALSENSDGHQFKYLSVPERAAIRKILRETLDDLPRGW